MTDTPETTFRLIYASRSRIPAERRSTGLDEVLAISRENNTRRGVTGALLASDDWFVQTLEGEEDTVRALYAKISADDRHDEVTLLQSGLVEGRVFGRWSMAWLSEDGTPEVALIARAEQVSMGERGDTLPPMSEVLQYMREVLDSVSQD